MVLPKRLDQRRVAGLAEASLMVALLTCGYAFASAAGVPEEQSIEIVHTALQCWPAEEHIVLSADVQPSGDVQKTLLYFRWDRHAAWYFVPMTLNTQGVWVSVLPKTLPGTTGVVYFFESMSSSYMSTRSSEYRAPVKAASDCENPGAVIYTGSNPNITLGATRVGQPVPPGFDVSGVGAYVSPTGITSGAGTGGGISGKTIAILGGAGAAGAAVALLGGGSGDATTTTDGIGGITTTIAASTSTMTGGGPSSSTTSVSGGNSTSSGSGGGSSSSPTSGPSTSPTTGPSTSPTTNPTTAPTTNPSTAPTTNPSTAPTTSPGSCPSPPSSWRADASVSVSPQNITVPINGVFSVTITGGNSGPDTACGLRVDLTKGNGLTWIGTSGAVCPLIAGKFRCTIGDRNPGQSFGPITFSFRGSSAGPTTSQVSLSNGTTDPNTGNNNRSFVTNVNPLHAQKAELRNVSFESTLYAAGGPPQRGRIVSNGTEVMEIDSSSPRTLRIGAHTGQNTLEAYLESGTGEAEWRFEFGSTEAFVPGSIRVESGVPVATDSRSIVFVTGPGAAPPRFTYSLRADDSSSASRP